MLRLGSALRVIFAAFLGLATVMSPSLQARQATLQQLPLFGAQATPDVHGRWPNIPVVESEGVEFCTSNCGDLAEDAYNLGERSAAANARILSIPSIASVEAATGQPATWTKAFLSGDHPWGGVCLTSGFAPSVTNRCTNSWLNYRSDDTSEKLGNGLFPSIRYKVQFNVPSFPRDEQGNPLQASMRVKMKVDNWGKVWINGESVPHVIWGDDSVDASALFAQTVREGLNTIELVAGDGGGAAGFTFLIELSMHADAPLTQPLPGDADGDGVPDDTDAFPGNPNESADTDGDGVGDNSDVFPNDPTETRDSDEDGIGDNSDPTPNGGPPTVGVPVDIKSLGGGQTSPHDASDGFITGTSRTASGETHPFLWSAATGRMTDLGLPAGMGYGEGINVNSHGDVVGYAYTPDFSEVRGFYKPNGGAFVDLGPGQAHRINDNRVVAGLTAEGVLFRWSQAGGFQYLTDPIGASPFDINARGDILGMAQPYLLFAPIGAASATVIAAPVPDGVDEGYIDPAGYMSSAYRDLSLTDSGVVAGQFWYYPPAGDPQMHPFTWTAAGGFVDFRPLLASPVGGAAMAINHAGQVAGMEFVDASFWATRGFIVDACRVKTELSPLPGDELAEGSRAEFLTDTGVIAGHSGYYRAVLWQHGVPVSIQDLRPAGSNFGQEHMRADVASGNLIGGVAVGHGEVKAWAMLVEPGPAPVIDTDCDGVADDDDQFPEDPNEVGDRDGDGVGDNADAFPDDHRETVDSDGDGVGDNGDVFPHDAREQHDSDGDGVGDNADAFDNDSNETTDSDGDGTGDNADAFDNDPTETTDSDGDGTGDNADAFDNDSTETTDTDRDGTGDNADAFDNDPTETKDTDGDGTGDNADAFDNDPTETKDTDGDGVGDNADAFDNDPTETKDSDGDGVGDNKDAFPNNPAETKDSDGDGVGDNADAFDNDPTETKDSDGDGVGDNRDAFPTNPAETKDTDGDGTGDNADAFDNDPTETKDTDGDGVGDNKDAFPTNPAETNDSDGDGVGDNADAFDNDPTETKDSDGDGVGDNKDAFDNDPTETKDSDGDGVGDNADAFDNDPTETKDSDGDGVGDNADAFDNDPTETKDTDGDGVGDNKDLYPNDPGASANLKVAGVTTTVPARNGAQFTLTSGETACVASAPKNHGQYSSCVGKVLNAMKAQGVITESEKGYLQSVVAQSPIGKK
jgi:probable HAF family extracellular repeat protein